jgi:hypothetical protein
MLGDIMNQKVARVVHVDESFNKPCLVFENGYCLFLNDFEIVSPKEAKDLFENTIMTVQSKAKLYKEAHQAKSIIDGILIAKGDTNEQPGADPTIGAPAPEAPVA